MRLLILNYEYPPLGGGAGRCSQYQAEGLARLGYEVSVITTWFEGEKEIEEGDHLKLIRLKSRRKKAFRSNPLEMFSWALKTYRYIRKNKLYLHTDLVLAHFSLPGGIVALPMYMLNKVPYIIISHGQDIPWFSPKELFFYHLIFYLPIKWICSRASKVTVLSQQRLNELDKLTATKHHSKHHIIPNGCDIGFFTPPESEKERDTLRILFVGRLTRQKDPFTLLNAVQDLSNSGTPFLLEIVGDGPLRRKMESFVKNHQLKMQVRFSGWISREELREKYRSAHLLLITSVDEGQSLAMMEAIASGLYLISTKVSGSESLIHEKVSGEYIPFGDPQELAHRLEAYYKEKLLEFHSVPDRILQELRQSISWDHYVHAYDRIIQA
jgi:glycosyltransferase involved in cell wall biosynthesis